MYTTKNQVDPRLALIFLVSGSVVIFYFNNTLLLLLILFFYVLLYLNLQHKRLKQVLMVLIFSTLMLIVINLIFNYLAQQELTLAVLRLCTLNVAFSWFFLNTSPEDLTKALIWFKIPYRWAWTFSGAYRYINLFKRETEEIIDAQLVRGIPLDGSIKERLRHLSSIIIPLVYRTNVRTQQLAEALFARCWIPAGNKSFLHPLNFKTKSNFLYSFLFVLIMLITSVSLFI